MSIELRQGALRAAVLCLLIAGSGCKSDSAGNRGSPQPVLSSIRVQPASATVANGLTRQFSAFAVYSDGSEEPVAEGVAWRSTDEAIATVNGSGLATGRGEGTTDIVATYLEVEGSAELTVGPPVLTDLVVTPTPVTLEIGQTQPLQAEAVYSDGSREDATDEAAWSSDAPGIAAVDAAGLVSALAVGSTAVDARLGELTGSAQITVIEVSTPPPPFAVGAAEESADPPSLGLVCLGGYGFSCHRPPEFIKDPLLTGALAITGADGGTFILVKTTNVGFFAAYKAQNGANGIYDIRQRIAAEIRRLYPDDPPLTADRIVVVSDHSHAGPDTIGIWGGVTRAYMDLHAQAAVTAGVRAYQNRAGAVLSVAALDKDTPGVPEVDSSYRDPPSNNPDEEFRVLFADRPAGGRIATWVNYGPHATVLGSGNRGASGDWTAWVGQVINEPESLLGGGVGIGTVGALGATDFEDTSTEPRPGKTEAEARARLRRLIGLALETRTEVAGNLVDVESVFVREPLAQPVLLLNYIPFLTDGQGEIRIDRAVTAPWNTGAVIGTYTGAVRIGDVFVSIFPGEPFPQLQYALRDEGGVPGARAHFLLGGANDFLGYMVRDDESYQQTLQEGAFFLPGCPEEAFYEGAGIDYDGACPDHWTLMVSPTIGRHLVCTIQDAADRLGFETGERIPECEFLTAFDGVLAPAEYPATDPVSPSPGAVVGNPAAGIVERCRAEGAPAEMCDGLEAVSQAIGAAADGALHDGSGVSPPAGPSKAGVAVRDASWHLGASAGQFSASGAGIARDAGFDPYGHSVRKVGADILGTRISTRALVVEDGDGNRVAIAANDLYLPNDLLHRRTAQLLAEHDARAAITGGVVTGITSANLATTSSHSHTSPFYSTPAWGTWIFQDVFDLRFYEYMARQMADAVIEATGNLKPVRMGGTTVRFNGVQSHTYGPKTDAENGTPAGQPYDYTTQDVTVVRFDEVDGTGAFVRPLANWVVFGVHPEWVWGEEIVNGDVTHATMRMLDRETGAITVMSQRETGASGPHKDTRVHEPQARREFQESALAGADRGARLLANRVKQAWASIALGAPEDPTRFAALRTHFRVNHASQRFAPPATRPYPGISNCNTDPFWDGHVGLPILGFPDCFYDHTEFTDVLVEPFLAALPFSPRDLKEQLDAAGVPVPSSYSATSFTAVEETAAVHLQVFKLGDIVATMCPCEQFTSQALNIETRLDRVPGNLWHGWDWVCQLPASHPARAGEVPAVTQHCARQNARYPDSRGMQGSLADAAALQRIRAQIHNDATGWELDPMYMFNQQTPEPIFTLGAEAEPADTTQIKGNFTHEEFTSNGYGLVISVGMVNDYWGYVPEYREYRSHDHYRKALNGLGPHGSDFLATRLARMAAALNGASVSPPLNPLDPVYQAESGRAEAFAQTLGELARAYSTAYELQLPPDGGAARITRQPEGLARRFSAATVEFVGGSNFEGMPQVRVERLVAGTVGNGTWETYGNQDGEVQLQLAFLPALASETVEIPFVGEGAGGAVPDPGALALWRAGMFEWVWTATFEAFVSEIGDLGGRPGVTPEGVYRFVIEGPKREIGGVVPYQLVSGAFTVVPWGGIRAQDMRVEADGRVSFGIGPVSSHRRFKHNAGSGDIVIPDTEPPLVVGPVDYPDSYTGGLSWIRDERQLFTYGSRERADDPGNNDQQYCSRCTFRPWADTAAVVSATVSVGAAAAVERTMSAQLDPSSGRWITAEALEPGESAFVGVGGIVDEYGEFNAAPSPPVTRPPAE